MSDPTTPEGRAELRELLRGLAVARPWHVEEMPETQEGRVYSLEVDGMPWIMADRIEVNDARLIVAAVNALPALLDLLDRVYALAPTLIEDALGAAEHGEFRRLHVREAARQLREELGGDS